MTVICLLLLLLLAPGLGAQAEAPGEPDIVLPEVILQIADLSVETVEAGLPPPEELLPPPAERAVPLPEQIDLPLLEAEFRPLPPEAQAPADSAAASGLFAEILLGAGNMSHLLSSVTLTRPGGTGLSPGGGQAGFSFAFRHEMLDGFNGHAPGSGFHNREDDLKGQLKLPLGKMDFQVRGSFADREQGLQGLSLTAQAVGAREGEGSARLSVPVGEQLRLDGGLEAGFAAQLLSGSGAAQQTETVLRPEIAAVYKRGIFWAGLNARAGRRTLSDDPEASLNRFAAGIEAGFETEGGVRLEARGGWFVSSEAVSVFPFDLTLTLPVTAFTVRAAGGYRVTEIDYRDLLNAYVPVGFPAAGGLKDDHGWFGKAGVSVRLSSGFSLLAEAEAAGHTALPDLEADSLTADGLFLFSQSEALTVQSRLGARWNPFPPLSLSAGWTAELADLSRFAPREEPPARHLVTVEAEAVERSARWSARGVLRFRPEEGSLPELSLEGSLRLGENISLGAEGRDLLAAFDAENRGWLSPYEAPGARGLVTLRINF